MEMWDQSNARSDFELASRRRARRKRAFNLFSLTPQLCAASRVDNPCIYRRLTAVCMSGLSPPMLRDRTRRRSLTKQSCSGLGLESTIQSATGAAVPLSDSSNDTASCVRRLRSCISAALITIRVSQVESPDRPSKRGRFLKADNKPSWRASSASSGFRTIPRTRR